MENLVHIGHVSRVHGFKGQVKIALKNNISIKKRKGLVLFVEFANKPVPFFLDSVQEQSEHLLAHFEDIHSDKQAEELQGRSIFAESKSVQIDEDAFEMLIGYKIIDQEKQLIGIIEEVLNYNQYLAKITLDGREVLLPMNEDTILKVNHKKKEIQLYIPEGLLDFYKNQ